MKQLVISAGLVLLINFGVMAQINVRASNIQDFTGKPIMNNAVSDLKGSFFYNDDYINAKMYLANGTELINIKVKLNLRDNNVYYLNNDGSEMEAVSKVKRIVFMDKGIVFENGFPAVNKQDQQTYYRVIISGKASLLILTNFVESEYKEFNSAITTKQIDKVNEIFGVSPNAIARLKKTDDVLQLLSDKNKEVYNYIITNNLKCKKQPDYENVISYYNSLN